MIPDPEKRAMMYAYVEQREAAADCGCKCDHAANEASAKVIDADVREAADLQRQRAWLQSPAYWRLVWAGQIAAGITANPDDMDATGASTANVAKRSREQADALVAEMFGEVE
jgi:hypothetical protein